MNAHMIFNAIGAIGAIGLFIGIMGGMIEALFKVLNYDFSDYEGGKDYVEDEES